MTTTLTREPGTIDYPSPIGQRITALWFSGHDTQQIADWTGMAEAMVYNFLAKRREFSR